MTIPEIWPCPMPRSKRQQLAIHCSWNWQSWMCRLHCLNDCNQPTFERDDAMHQMQLLHAKVRKGPLLVRRPSANLRAASRSRQSQGYLLESGVSRSEQLLEQ